MKKLVLFTGMILALLGMAYVAMLITDTAYLISGIKTTYLRGQTSVDIYD
jgi:hypothetical protein